MFLGVGDGWPGAGVMARAEMKVIGYSRELSVFPGEQVNFRELRRRALPRGHRQADSRRHQSGGLGSKIEEVFTDVDANFPGRVQRVYSGSHVLVDDHPRLPSGDFTLQVLICPDDAEGRAGIGHEVGWLARRRLWGSSSAATAAWRPGRGRR